MSNGHIKERYVLAVGYKGEECMTCVVFSDIDPRGGSLPL